jgi:hypothetical protein
MEKRPFFQLLTLRRALGTWLQSSFFAFLFVVFPNTQRRGPLLILPLLFCSAADPGCSSRILIFTHLGSRITDPGSLIQKQQYFIFEMPKKKIWANFQIFIELFTKKTTKLVQKYGIGIRDPGSRGKKKAPGPRSGSATLLFCLQQIWLLAFLWSSFRYVSGLRL